MKFRAFNPFFTILFFSLCVFLLVLNITSSSYALSLSSENRFDIIDPSGSSSGSVGDSTLDVDILVNPSFPSFVSLPHIGDTISKRVGYAFAGSNPSFEARLNNKKNTINIKSVDITDSKNKTFFEIPFKATPVPGTEDEIVLTLNIPNSVSSGLAKFVLNTNNGIVLLGEIEVINFFNISANENSKLFGEPSISRVFIRKLNDSFSLTIQGKNFAPKNLIYSSKDLPNEKLESASRSNTSIVILPNTLNIEIEEVNVSKGNDSIKVNFKLEDLKDDVDAVVVVSTPRGTASKPLVLKSNFFGF